jgi:hypothetical protein
MRMTNDKLASDGTILDGYDYSLQVWVRAGVVQDCGHPDSMRPGCCNGGRYAGLRVKEVCGHEERKVVIPPVEVGPGQIRGYPVPEGWGETGAPDWQPCEVCGCPVSLERRYCAECFRALRGDL